MAKGLERTVNDAGWQLYIDWEDALMPERPNRKTAERIQLKIRECSFFLFLATGNSMASRWCPWEIGYADGKKSFDRILIIPTVDGGTTHGSEYLDIYKRVDHLSDGRLGTWLTGESTGTPIENL